jgi:hypothetical protein
MLNRLLRLPSGHNLPALLHKWTTQRFPALAGKQKVPQVAQGFAALEHHVTIAAQ